MTFENWKQETAHMIIGGLEQAKQKVIRELDKMLEKVLEEKYFGLEGAS